MGFFTKHYLSCPSMVKEKAQVGHCETSRSFVDSSSGDAAVVTTPAAANSQEMRIICILSPLSWWRVSCNNLPLSGGAFSDGAQFGMIKPWPVAFFTLFMHVGKLKVFISGTFLLFFVLVFLLFLCILRQKRPWYWWLRVKVVPFSR